MKNKRMMTINGVATSCGMILLASALTMGLWGCQSGGQNNADRNPPPASTTPPPDQAMNQPHSHADPGATPGEPAATIPARTDPKPTPTPRRPKPPAPAPVKNPAVFTVPSGTALKASLSRELRSDRAQVGEPITLTVVDAVSVNGTMVIPAGATIQGEVVQAKASGKVSGQGELRLAFKSVVDASGNTRPIAAETFYAEAESGTDADVARVAGGAAAGAIIGGLLGGKKGAGVGGLIGAAAGTGTVLATSGPQVKLAAGQLFEVKLIEPLEIPS